MEYIELIKLAGLIALAAVAIKIAEYIGKSLVGTVAGSIVLGLVVGFTTELITMDGLTGEIKDVAAPAIEKAADINPIDKEEIVVLTEKASDVVSINSVPEQAKEVSVKVLGVGEDGLMKLKDSISETEVLTDIIRKAAASGEGTYDDFVASLGPIQKKVLESRPEVAAKIRNVMEN